MLEFHLNPETDLASRKPDFIERSVAWMKERFRIGPGTRIVDFGCGPGLYASRLAKLGAKVTGIDFSRNSLDYARRQAAAEHLAIDYVEADYLSYKGKPASCDLIILIYCDLCPLSPVQRQALLTTIREMLAPGGRLLFDVWTSRYYASRREEVEYAHRLMDGFWSPGDYFGFHHCFLYDVERIVLDKYTIVEPQRTRSVYNWLKCYAPGELEEELKAAGFAVEDTYANVAGEPMQTDSPSMALVVRREE
jgi:SAM-dependent methyltransferase